LICSDKRRGFNEKAYRKAVNNNSLIYFAFMDRICLAEFLRKVEWPAAECAMIGGCDANKGATTVDGIPGGSKNKAIISGR
jgi:hypothetical protein